MDCNIKSLYLCVKSMERAIAFYENFFEKPELRFLNENNEMVIITLSNDFIIHDFPTKRGRLNRTISCDKEKVEILDNFTSYTFKRK